VNLLVSVYRAWPFRPHCGGGGHVALCRWLGLSLGKDPWCPAKDA
jgi:hypothetical protein